jgi:glucose/arabinose dehydrogenase
MTLPFSSTPITLVSSSIALAFFFALAADSTGIAQQPPAAAGAAPQGAAAPPAPGRGDGRGQGRGRGPAVDTLGAGPWDLGAGRGRIRVTVVSKGLERPWGIAFIPDGSLLVTERPGRLRVIRNGVLDPTPIKGLPEILPGGLGGLMDVALHPNFAQNRQIYLTYSKPRPGGASTVGVVRARWDGGPALSDVKDIIVTEAWHPDPPPTPVPAPTQAADAGPGGRRGRGAPLPPGQIGPDSGSYGSRLAFDKNGFLFVTLGDRNFPAKSQVTSTDVGKILRYRDDGTVPPDNPFVGKAGYRPEIYSVGHRNPLGLAFHPETGELWSTEQGPQGGDELNRIQAGKNYGWPEVSLGRNYDGTVVGKGFTAPGFEEPVVFWVPAIAVSGLSWYNGDKFPAWRGNALVGAMRNGTGKYVQRIQFNAQGLPTGRESMLAELNQRIRDVRPGPDGFVYVLTDEDAGAVLKIEPGQ